MVTANDLYKEYSAIGGLSGIIASIIDFLKTDWEKHDIILKLLEKASELYLKIFPHGKPPASASEAIRRIGIVAAYLGRLRRLKSPKLKDIEPLAREYIDLAHRMMYYRNAWKELREYLYAYSYLFDLLRTAKVTVNEYKKMAMYFDVIRGFYERTKHILDILSKRHPNAIDIWNFFSKRFSLGTLWIEFTYVLTADTPQEYMWTHRVLEIHIKTWTHAELLFHDITDKRLSEVTDEILRITDNDWLLAFDEFGSHPYEFESKQLLRFMNNTIPIRVDFEFTLYDHNYDYDRVKAYGKIPYNWQVLTAKEIIDEILKTGDILYAVIRGEKGALKKGIKYVLDTKKVGDLEVNYVEKVLYYGTERPITDFIKWYSIKEKVKRKEKS